MKKTSRKKKIGNIIVGSINKEENMKIKAVIFDFNGTMVLDGPYHNQAWKMFSKELRGYPMSDDEINTHVHGVVNEKIIEYLKPGISKEKNKEYSLEKEAWYRKIASEDAENYQLVKGLSDFLDELKAKNIKMNIASASIKANIDFFVETFHLENWFDPSKIVYDDGTHDNKVSMFQLAAKRMGCEPNECLVFEDSVSGISCAKRAGVKTIIVVSNQPVLEDSIAITIKDFSDPRIKGYIEE